MSKMPMTQNTEVPTILGPPVGYTDLLDHEIREKLKREEEAKAEGRHKFFPLRPSAAGYCARRLAYDLMSYRGHAHFPQEPKEPHVYRLLELGHSVEYSVLRNFELLKIVQPRYKQQVLTFFKLERLDPDSERELIEGSCDVVLVSKDYKCVMDVKSQKDGFSAFYATRWDETLAKFDQMKTLTKVSDTCWYADNLEAFLNESGDAFLSDNLYQLNLYACSEFLQARGVDHAAIYKYNKNDSRHYELRFRPSPALAKRVQEKFNLISKCVDAKKPEDVPREAMLGSMRCAFCPFSQECWGGEDARRAWLTNLPPKQWPKDTHKLGQTGQRLEELITTWEALASEEKRKEKVEAAITEILVTHKLPKIRTAAGRVYEAKYLKTGGAHYELRRSKA